MANEIVSSTTSSDQEKMLASKLLERSYQKLVMASLMDKVKMQQGAGLTASFVRYKRMYVPIATLTEGTDPANSSFSLETATVTLDQWGDIITVTDRAILTTKHPLIQQCVKLLADNAARVMDREIQVVVLSGTNVQYADGSVAARKDLGPANKLSEDVILKARTTLVDTGAPPRGGPAGDAKQVQANGTWTAGQAYVAVAGPQVIADLLRPGSSLGTVTAVATYANQKALYNAEIGTWCSVRWVETNFIPKFTLFGNNTVAVASGANPGFGTGTPVVTAVDGGGTITSGSTMYFKVTRLDLLRGFEEAISIEHTIAATATGNNESFTFVMPSTQGYAYKVYAGSATGDANLFEVSSTPSAAGATLTVTAIPTTGNTAPANIASDGSVSTVHPIYIFAEEAMNWVGFYDAQVSITKDESIIGNVLRLKRAIGYKFFGKAMIRDNSRLLRIEVASTF